MPKLNIFNFSGGINNAISPHLIGFENALDTLDVDSDSGSMVPFRGAVEIHDPGIAELSNQNGQRSLSKFGSEFYWSDNITGELSSSLGHIGITPPSTKMLVRGEGFGNRFTGIYKYLVIFETDEGFRSAATLPGDEFVAITEYDAAIAESVITNADAPAFNRLNVVLSRWYGYNQGDIVVFEGRVYRCRANFGQRVALHFPDGLDTPVPSLDTIRWEDITDIAITYSGYNSLKLTSIPQPIESSVTRLLIFRTVAGGSDFFLVNTIDPGTTIYVDTLLDAQLIINEQLRDNNGFPPVYELENNTWIRRGGKYLTEVDEVYHVANGETLYQSLQGDPHSYNPKHSIMFDGVITGIAKFLRGVIVFIGNGQPYYVSGSVELGDISKIPMPTNQGCSNWATIAYANNAPLWKSEDGICVARQTRDEGIHVTVITKSRYIFPKEEPKYAVTHLDIYYLFYSDHCVCMDLGRNKIYRRSLKADYALANKIDGNLYLVKDSKYYSVESGEGKILNQSYTSPEFSFGSTVELKKGIQIDVNSKGSYDYTVFLDGKKELSKTMPAKGSVTDFMLPSKEFYRIQLKLESSKQIDGFSIEFENVN